MEIKSNFLLIENKRWVIVSIILALLVVLPVLILFFSFFSSGNETLNYLLDTVLLDYTINTIYLILLTSFFALLFGVFPAWVVSNNSFKGRSFFDVVLYLPLAIPSYIMGYTYIEILSFTGPIQTFVRYNTPLLSEFFNQDYLQVEVLGIILGLALYPYIYTASRISFSMIGSNYLNISKNLGLKNKGAFFKVVLPLSRPAIFSGLFLVIMEVLNEYGAVKYFGVNTYTAGIFRSWNSFGDVDGAIQLASILIAVVLIFFLIERFSYRKSKFYYNKNTQLNIRHNPSKNKSILYFLICFIPFFLGFLVPFTFIFFNTLDTINLADFTKVINLTINSISVSTLSSFLVILFALFFLYVERISKTKINSYISNLISLGYALPGAVIALSLMILFSDSLVVGTFGLLLFAYIIRFLAVGKSPIKSSLDKQPETIDDTGKNLGLGPFDLLKKVHLPINRFALISAFIVTFIDVLKELPITLILRPFNFDTLATQTYEFAVEEMLPLSSIYSLIIIILGSLMLLILESFIDKELDVSKS